jgi:RNA polymerase primary sigma factor
MEIRLQQMADHLTITQEPISLDIFRRFGDDSVPLTDLLEDDRSDSPEQVVITQTLGVQIRDLLNSLTNRERQVIRLRYGLDGCREHTLHEVGRKLGLSHEAVRQIESRALHKLDPLSRKRALNDFLDQ